MQATKQRDIFPKWQFGFRKNKNTVTASTILYEAVNTRLSAKPKSKPTYVAFIDFSKCFDSIRRDFLYIKLQKAGIPFDICKLLHFIYNNTRSYIISGIRLVGHFESTIGLPQGCGLSPILFCIFVHDLPDFLSHEGVSLNQMAVKFLQFADDLALLATSPSELQTALDDLSKSTFHIDGREIEIVNSFTYLGFTFTPQLKFSQHLQNITARAASKSGVLLSKLKPLNISIDIMIDLFDCYILPIYNYGLGLWIGKCSENSINSANAVFSKFLKRYLGIPYRSNNAITYLITETQPLLTTLINSSQNSLNSITFPKVLNGHKLALADFANSTVSYNPIPLVPTSFWMSKTFYSLPTYARSRRLLCRDIFDIIHFDLCKNDAFHVRPYEDCICMACGERATSYHHYDCKMYPSH